MNMLKQAGMSVSSDMIEASEQNRGGAFEDSEIFALHTELLSNLSAKSSMPLPEGWVNHPSVSSIIARLGEIAISRIDSAESIWGFKDPRINCLLPLWIRIFNKHKIVPVYLLAVRDPAVVASSMNRQYWIPRETGELTWLQRNLDALSHTGGNCCIIHYEDWKDRSQDVFQILQEYTGLPGFSDQSILNRVLDLKADRSVFDSMPIVNREVKRLYASLIPARGDNFDSKQLMKCVMDCRQVQEGYVSWLREIYRQSDQSERNTLRIASLKSELQTQINEHNARRSSLTDQIDQLKAASDSLERKLASKGRQLKSLSDNLFCNQKEVLRYKFLAESYALIINLQRAYTAVVSSARWKSGNLIVRPIELLMFRWKKVLITRQINVVFDQLLRSPKNNQIEDRIRLQIVLLEKLHGHTDSLFASMRWRSGCRTISLIESFIPGTASSEPETVIREIFKRIDKRTKNLSDKLENVLSREDPVSVMMSSGANGRHKKVNLSNHSERSTDITPSHSQAQSVAKTQPQIPIELGQQDLPCADQWSFKRDIEESKISIIMPVYNAEEWILDTFESVFDQSYTNWELICIDDGSTDQSAEIIERVAAAEHRILLIKLGRNYGKSAARNMGLSESSGEYLFFIDADDWLNRNALALLHDELVAEDVDMAIGQILKVRDGSHEHSEGVHAAYQHRRIKRKTPEEEPALLENVIVCNKLIRRKFLESTACAFFNQTLERFEDTELSLKWWLNVPKVTLVNEYTYFYRQHADDLPCRSNRKAGGLEAAPQHRLALIREMLRYRHEASLDDETIVAPTLLYILLSNLYQCGFSPTSERNKGLTYAMDAAQYLKEPLLNKLSEAPGAVLKHLKRTEPEDAMDTLDRNWKVISGSNKVPLKPDRG